MSWRIPRLPIALLAVAALAFGGCGEGDDGTTTGTSPAAAYQRDEDSGSAEQKAPDTSDQGQNGKGSPVEGSKAAAPGVPTSKYGDNSIQTWGFEGSRAERARLTAIVRAYLDARAARDWEAACSHLAAKVRAEQSKFAGGASCADAMESFAADTRDAILAQEADIDVLSARTGGGYAFLIYRGSDGVYAMPLAPEEGAWRLLLVTPNPLS